MCVGLHVKYFLLLSGFNETRIFSDRLFEKCHENPSSGSRDFPVRPDMMKLTVAFRSSANTPTKVHVTDEGIFKSI